MRVLLIGSILALLVLVQPAYASYVLPYPSFMPGHGLYNVSRLLDSIKRYWYWGDKGSLKYHSMLADKYIVEAKVLFEYGQYLLAVDALNRSDKHIGMLQKKSVEQMEAHSEILTKLTQVLPVEFIWQPEKESPTKLMLHEELREAISIRNE